MRWTKKKWRFRDSRQVHQAVRHAVENALAASRAGQAPVAIEPPAETAPAPAETAPEIAPIPRQRPLELPPRPLTYLTRYPARPLDEAWAARHQINEAPQRDRKSVV